MKLKCLSQRLSSAGFILALGLIASPESVSATVLESVKTNTQEFFQPTLLVNSAEQVSILTENTSGLKTDSNSNSIVARATSNSSNINNGVVTENNVSRVITPSFDQRLKTSATSFKSAGKFTVADNHIISGNQGQSLSIPVNSVESPNLIKTESVSIPIAIENSDNSAGVSAVNIPVVPSAKDSFIKQQTESNTTNNVITLDVEEPTFISNGDINANSTANENNINLISASSQDNFEDSSQNSNLVSVVPIQIEYYDPTMSPAVGDIGSPNLPQLNSPDPYLPESQRPFRGYIWPAKGVFTSGYGWRWGRMHRGIDIAAPVGTPIFAAADGEVITAGWNSGGFGNLVKIRHYDGSVTLYAHNSKILVRRGQNVTQGQQIAKMGSTGFSTGPHLHFEIHPNGSKAVDPIAFLPKKEDKNN